METEPVMIIVTGATGKLGRQVVGRLLEEIPPAQIGVSVRDPAKARDLLERGVRVRQGDFGDPGSLVAAFEGATQLMLVSSNARASSGDAIAQHRDAIAAAKRAGIRRIIYTSHMAASSFSAFAPMHDHAATEALLAESGLDWTALRNGFYASTVPQLIGDAATTGVVAAPADGKVAWTTHDDLAAAAARILIDKGRFDGPTPPLTASDALDLSDACAILAELTGRAVERQLVTDEDQAAKLAAAGLSPAAVDISLGLYRAARAGEFARTDPALAALIGREPIGLCEVLAPTLNQYAARRSS